MKEKVGIVGYGWVGKAVHKLFPEAVIYTDHLGTKEEINKCTVVFICVPTPCPKEGALDTSDVFETIKWCEAPLLVVRSTVNPRDCAMWKILTKKHIVMQPEYLGETPQHPLLDTAKTPFLILGGDRMDLERLITLYTTVYNANVRIRQVTAYAAEIIKLCENRAIAFKVAECQELYDVCKANDVDYYTVRDAVYGDDPRFNLWWTFIYPDNRGFNSKCIPKDVYAWCAWAESAGYDPKITRAILKKNKEWIKSNEKL
jgi:UDPglucose 6-dehydrogenase